MTPGTVALVWFPFSRGADEPYKKRPVLVLTEHGTPPDQVIFCAMITSNERRVARPGPGDVLIADWQGAGLLKPSVVRTRRLWTAERRDVASELGWVGHEVLEQTRASVRDMLGL